MKKFQRLLAMAGVVILFAMVILTLILAIIGSPYFKASMYATLTLPLLMYAFLFIYRLMKGSSEEDRKPGSEGKDPKGQKGPEKTDNFCN